MKKLIAYFTATIMTMAVFTGCNDSDNGKEKSESASKSDSASQENEEEIPEDIVPNAESDFIWHTLTPEEVATAQYVGGVVITDYVGESDEVVIPKTIDNKPVVAIGEFAFSPYSLSDISYYEEDDGSCTWIELIEIKLVENLGIDDEYTSLQNNKKNLRNTFCSELEEIDLELEEINNCYQTLKDYCREEKIEFNSSMFIEYLDSVGRSDVANLLGKYTEEELLYLCTWNGDIDSSDDEPTKQELSEYFFSEYTLSDIWEKLNTHKHISDLKSVLIPDSVSLIGSGAFAYCDSLESVLVYGIDNGEILLLDDGVWTDVEAAEDYNFIEGCQFFACSELKETNFYLDVDDCGSCWSYQYCFALENIYLYPGQSGVVTLTDDDSYLCGQKVKSITFSEGCKEIAANDEESKYIQFDNCTVYIPESVTEINGHAFCTHNNMNGQYSGEGSSVPDNEVCDYSGVNIVTPAGSYAEQYAKEHGINYKSE